VFTGPVGTEVKNSLDRIYYGHSLQIYWQFLCKFQRRRVGRKGNTLQLLALLMCDLHKEALRSRRKCKTLKRWLCKTEVCIHTNWNLKILEKTDITQTLKKWHYIQVRHRSVSWQWQIQSTFSQTIFKIISVLFPWIQLSFPSVLCALFLSVFLTGTLYALLLSLSLSLSLGLYISSTWSFLYSIILIVFGDHSKLRCSTACSSLNSPSFSL
jgi:hypothetical protein